MELIFGIQHLRDSENCTFKQVWQNKKFFSAVLTYPALKFCLTFSFHPHNGIQFSSVTPGSLRPHELQHASPSCPSPTPGAYSNSCPSCHIKLK